MIFNWYLRIFYYSTHNLEFSLPLSKNHIPLFYLRSNQPNLCILNGIQTLFLRLESELTFVVKYIKRISESPADLHHEEQCHIF